MLRKPSIQEWITGSGLLIVGSAIFTHWGDVQALAQSKLPAASQEQVAQLATQFQGLATQVQNLAGQQAQNQRTQDFMEQENLERELDRMTAAHADINDRRRMVDQINIIRVRLQLPPIVRP